MEKKILRVVERLGQATVRELQQRIYGIDSLSLRYKLLDLVRAKILEEVRGEQTVRYRRAR